LLVLLRSKSVIAERRPGTTPVDEELRRFDDHMRNVRGLAPKTRSMALRIVRLLLLDLFGDFRVVISAIKPEDVRRFVAGQRDLYGSPASAGPLASALRGYFRFRATCGDQVHGLIGVVSYPANWQGITAEGIQQRRGGASARIARPRRPIGPPFRCYGALRVGPRLAQQ
jgi:integrase/recombinase XerC